jgi:hypothetical protein
MEIISRCKSHSKANNSFRYCSIKIKNMSQLHLHLYISTCIYIKMSLAQFLDSSGAAEGDDMTRSEVGSPSTPSLFSAIALCIRIMTKRVLRWTSASRGHAFRQCKSISAHPEVCARTLTNAGVMERLRNTRHPRFSMDLFTWKFFMASMVRRTIW